MSTATDLLDAPAQAADAILVTLSVADQLCGIPVLEVRDVLGPQPITRIPLAAPAISGSLNLRGRIVTAIDLRRRLRLPDRAVEAQPMSVVVERGGELYALLVDQVAEVMALAPDKFEEHPPTLAEAWKAVSAGIYRLDGALLLQLDVGRLLSTDEGS